MPLRPVTPQCNVPSCANYNSLDACLCQACASGFIKSVDSMACVSDNFLVVAGQLPVAKHSPKGPPTGDDQLYVQ